jgi:hypothetical protein
VEKENNNDNGATKNDNDNEVPAAAESVKKKKKAKTPKNGNIQDILLHVLFCNYSDGPKLGTLQRNSLHSIAENKYYVQVRISASWAVMNVYRLL